MMLKGDCQIPDFKRRSSTTVQDLTILDEQRFAKGFTPGCTSTDIGFTRIQTRSIREFVDGWLNAQSTPLGLDTLRRKARRSYSTGAIFFDRR